MKNFWQGKGVVVTGAAFIGVHLAEKLIDLGARVKIFNLTDKHGLLAPPKAEFRTMDLRYLDRAKNALTGADFVFHLAAAHGGRGYVDTHQADTADNFLLDGSVFKACLEKKVGKVIFASSGCVYPNYLQKDTGREIYLREDMVKAPHDADNMYGWAKLMGEETLRAYYYDYGLRSVSCRYFTVYGEYGNESHAVMAMIAKAFIRQDPFEIWGDGTQIRNWTYVEDIVSGTILAAERIDDARAVNLGTTERITVSDAARIITDLAGYSPQMKYLIDMPTGPFNRVADNGLAQEVLDWTPRYNFYAGVKKTLDWYFSSKDKTRVQKIIEHSLMDKI